MVASKVVAAGGPFLLLTVLPGLYLIFGFALCSACVLTAQIVQPKLSAHRPIAVYSANYARWWTVRFPSFQMLMTVMTGLSAPSCYLERSLKFVCALQVNKLLHVTDAVFAKYLSGTSFLVWWYKALVRTLYAPCGHLML